MQDRKLFEYSIIRVVPRVEREEFINVGVILYCARPPFLKLLYAINVQRILALWNETDIEEVAQRLGAYESICNGATSSGVIGKLPPASRFRWLTANRSTIIQSSPVHPGLCLDPESTLQNLFEKFVQQKV